MDQEQKDCLSELAKSKKRALIYLDAFQSIQKAVEDKRSVYDKAGILMLVRTHLIRANKFGDSLQSSEQLKAREAINNMIELLDDMVMTHLQDNFLSDESLDSLIEEMKDCLSAELDYSLLIAMKGTGLDAAQVKELLGKPGFQMYETFKKRNE